jgi:hypothetical protein
MTQTKWSNPSRSERYEDPRNGEKLRMSQATLNRDDAMGNDNNSPDSPSDFAYRRGQGAADSNSSVDLPIKTKVRRIRRKRPSLMALIAAEATVFVVGFCFAIMATMLSGSVMTNLAQQQKSTAMARADAARKEQKQLEARIAEATRLSNIQAWADAQGMNAPDKVLDEGVKKNGQGNDRKYVASL